MRVRLYEVGSTSVGVVLRFDNFPVELGFGPTGELRYGESCPAPSCRIDQEDGQLVLSAEDSSRAPLVNDAALIRGALMPGDRLALGDRQFVVSYERTAAADPPPARYRIQTTAK